LKKVESYYLKNKKYSNGIGVVSYSYGRLWSCLLDDKKRQNEFFWYSLSVRAMGLAINVREVLGSLKFIPVI